MSIEDNITIYNEENEELLSFKKDKMTQRLEEISQKLKKKSLIRFLKDSKIESSNPENDEYEGKKKGFILFIIKIVGTFFASFYLIGVFQMIDVMNALKEELSPDIYYFIHKEYIKDRKTFYENYLTISKLIPSFSPFFLSALLSGLLINVLGFITVSIIVLAINFLIIFFGINLFDFMDSSRFENTYSKKQFIILLLLYILLYIIIGIIALAPIEIILDEYKKYDKHESSKILDNIKRLGASLFGQIRAEEEGLGDDKEAIKRHSEDVKKDYEKVFNKEKVINSDDLDINQRYYYKLKLDYKYNIKGFLTFYLISMISSSILKIYLNSKLMPENIDTGEKKTKFIVYIILFSTIPILIGLLLYPLYFLIYNKDKSENEKEFTLIQFGGYLIFGNKYLSKDKCCCTSLCKDFIEIIKKLNYSCCCQICSCLYCLKSIFCCKCSCKNNKRTKIKTNNTEKEEIYIVYKIQGKCSWLVDILTNPRVLIFIPLLYLFNSLNLGFDSDLTNNIEDISDKKIIIINIIHLISIFFFYFINYIFGKIINKSFYDTEDFKLYLYGLIGPIFIESIFSSVISILISYNVIKNDFQDYLIPISTASIEYIKILCVNYFSLYFKLNLDFGKIISNSMIFSFYLIIWDFFVLILNYFSLDKKEFRVFQIFFGSITSVFVIIFMIIVKCRNDIKNNISGTIELIDI